MRKILIIGGVTIGAVLLIAGIVFALLHSRGTGQIKTLTKELRASGMPASPTELDEYYDKTGPAAIAMGEQIAGVVKQITTRSDDADEVLFVNSAGYEANESIPADVIRNSRSYLAENQAPLTKLTELLATSPRARYPTDLSLGADALLEHLAPLRSGARLFALDALLAAIDGDAFRAERSLGNAFALAGTLRDEPLLISQLVRIALHGVAISGVEESVNRGNFSAAQLLRLQTLVTHSDIGGAFAQGLIGERAWGLGDLLTPAQEGEEYESLAKTLGAQAGDQGYLLDYGLYRAVDTARLIRDYNELFEITQLPTHERLVATDTFSEAITSRGTFGSMYSKILIPTLARSLEAEVRTEALHQVAAVTLAAARYRLTTSTSPTTLGVLVPQYIAELPTDPFTGGELQVRQNSSRIIVYSLGHDRDDDGGTPPPDGTSLLVDGDIYFEYVFPKK